MHLAFMKTNRQIVPATRPGRVRGGREEGRGREGTEKKKREKKKKRKKGTEKNDTSLERLQSACHHIFLKGPRARANACLKCRFMYTKEIRLAEMLRRTFDLQKNTLFSCLPVARPVYLLELSRRNELLRP